MTQQAEIDWDAVLSTAGSYPMEALHFVREGLSFTVQRMHEPPEPPEPPDSPEHSGPQEFPEALSTYDRHVSGQQLCFGLRDFAIRQYGLLAPVVLRNWKITRTDDFGRLVFAMVDHGVMSKTPNDTLDDFHSVYDFREVFSGRELRHTIGRRHEP